VQLSSSSPLTQEVAPVAAQAPIPQAVGAETKSSSTWLLQSSSTPLQVVSSTAGVPGVQLSSTEPLTQLVDPVEEQPPTPQVVGWLA
jgi:hypothetical protein